MRWRFSTKGVLLDIHGQCWAYSIGSHLWWLHIIIFSHLHFLFRHSIIEHWHKCDREKGQNINKIVFSSTESLLYGRALTDIFWSNV